MKSPLKFENLHFVMSDVFLSKININLMDFAIHDSVVKSSLIAYFSSILCCIISHLRKEENS